MLPTITIIMPCYNAVEHLPRSVGGVLAQTFTDWELIAVNDGSTDTTLAWLQSCIDSRLRVHSQVNQGVSVARNAGLRLAQGNYVAFLDADDTWEPTFLEKMLAALAPHENAVLAYCGWQNLGLSGDRAQPFIPPDYEVSGKREILFAGCRWPVHAVLTRRSAIDAAGGFNPHLKNAEDYALWLEVAGTRRIVRVSEVLAYYHFHGDEQASANRARAALQFLEAQQDYLARHRDFSAQLGRTRRRQLLYAGLLEEGYRNYWKRDLPTARTIFRRLLFAGYGGVRDWVHLLPALLPLSMHQILIRLLEKNESRTK